MPYNQPINNQPRIIMTHTITHPQHTEDYFKGFEAMTAKRQGMSFEACRDEFNMAHPVGFKPSSLAAYYYAKGEMEALHQTM
jgi:hypothetical protein